MDFFSYTTIRDPNRRVSPDDRAAQDVDPFYKRAILAGQANRLTATSIQHKPNEASGMPFWLHFPAARTRDNSSRRPVRQGWFRFKITIRPEPS